MYGKFKRLIFLLFKTYKRLTYYFNGFYYSNKTRILFFLNGINCESVRSFGTPVIYKALNAKCYIGKFITMNNGHKFNPIGRNSPCYIIINDKGILKIGNNVGMSSTAIVCEEKVSIGNNVLLGGNVCIYDTDFHALNHIHRTSLLTDKEHKKTSPVVVEDNVFIGAHSTILKGVNIGKNSIIGACSVVTKSVPQNQIWAGNPAKFIRLTE